MSNEIFCHGGHRGLREKGGIRRLRQSDRDAKLPKSTTRGDGCWLNGDGGWDRKWAGWGWDGGLFICFGLIWLGIWGIVGEVVEVSESD